MPDNAPSSPLTVEPYARISTRVTVTGNTATATITAQGNGRTVSRQVSGTVSELFFGDPPNTMSSALDQIFEELCRPDGLETISGTFSGESTMSSGSHFRWNGSVVFTRLCSPDVPGANGNYSATSGSVTYTASGRFPYAACQMNGNQQFNLNGGSMAVFGSPTQPLEQYTYSIDIGPLYPGPMDVAVSSCEPGAESQEGTTQSIPVGGPPLDPRESYISADGFDYQGIETQSESGVSFTYSWALRGEPD